MKLQTVLLSLTLLFALSTAYHCSISVIGSGLSGVYTAYRLASAKDSLTSAEHICLFESTSVLGGRLLPLTDKESEEGEIEGEVIEMGVETFNTAKHPLFNELVKFFGLATECAYGEEGMSEGMKRQEVFGVKTEESQRTQSDSFFKGQQGENQGVDWEGESSQGNWEGERTEQTGEMNPAGAVVEEMKGEQNTQGTEQTGEVNPAGAVVEEKRCRSAERLFSFLRNRIVYSNFSRVEDIPYTIKSLEVIKNLPLHAFMTVLGQYVSNEELDSIANEQDAGVRWEKAGEIIRRLANQDVVYKSIPIHELSMRMVIQVTLDLTNEELEAAKNLIQEFPHLNSLLSMNFEMFAIHHLRNLAAGEGEDRKISKFSGLRTVIDIMATEIKEKGVQIYLKSELDYISQTRDGSLVLHFAGSDNVVTTDRLFLAINKKNLLKLTGTDIWSMITPEAQEALGNLKSVGVTNGIIFYEDAWWRNFGLTDKTVHTDTVLDSISYFTNSDCVEGEKCPGYIRFRHIDDGQNNLNFDIVNPIRFSTVLSAYLAENVSEVTASLEENTEEIGQMGEEDLALLRQNLLRSKFVVEFLHNRLMMIHQGLPGFDKSSIESPKFAIIANWENDAIFHWGTVNLPSRIPYRDVVDAMIEPFSGLPIHLVNNDFSEIITWKNSLEASIVQVERVLNFLGLEKPEWNVNDKIYSSVVELD